MTRRSCVKCRAKLPKGTVGNLCGACFDERESNKYYRDLKTIGEGFYYDGRE